MPTDNIGQPKRTTKPTLAKYLESIEASKKEAEKNPAWKLNPGWRS